MLWDKFPGKKLWCGDLWTGCLWGWVMLPRTEAIRDWGNRAGQRVEYSWTQVSGDPKGGSEVRVVPRPVLNWDKGVGPLYPHSSQSLDAGCIREEALPWVTQLLVAKGSSQEESVMGQQPATLLTAGEQAQWSWMGDLGGAPLQQPLEQDLCLFLCLQPPEKGQNCWLDGWVYEWMNKRMNEFLSQKVSMHRKDVATSLSWQAKWQEGKNRK